MSLLSLSYLVVFTFLCVRSRRRKWHSCMVLRVHVVHRETVMRCWLQKTFNQLLCVAKEGLAQHSCTTPITLPVETNFSRLVFTNQRRALRIIYSYTNDMPYINALYCASIPSLVDRREQLSRKFFTSLLQPSSSLHILLPTPRDPIITTRLRSANKFPRLPSRTRKYQTFISYGLAYYQTS